MRFPVAPRSSTLFVLALLSILGAASCRDAAPPRQDAGSTEDASAPLTCQSPADCGGTGICVGGFCEAVTPCNADSECSEGVCHTTRGYCVECDGQHANECPVGSTCQFDFTCVALTAPDAGGADGGVCSGSCSTRDECAPDRVCSAQGTCCPPPARCFGPNDCPTGRPECNGATGVCFGGDSCLSDNDCNTKPGCEGGICRCDEQGVCSRRQDECASDEDCFVSGAYANKVCIQAASPTACVDAPACTSDAQCSSLGLVCDLRDVSNPSYQRCISGPPCTTANNCQQGQACVGMICVVEDCTNNPGLCQAGQVCEPTSRQCVNTPLGPCPNGDSDCQAGYFCNTTLSPSACRLGCRSNADCPGGVCNAQNACEGSQGPQGVLCGACTSNADCPAGTECFENPFLGQRLCYERCGVLSGGTCTLNPAAACNIGYCACLF